MQPTRVVDRQLELSDMSEIPKGFKGMKYIATSTGRYPVVEERLSAIMANPGLPLSGV